MNLHNITQKITRIKKTITNSLPYRQPQLIIILTLVTVITVQNTTTLQQNTYRAITNTVHAIIPANTVTYNKPEKLVACDYKCLTTAWVNLRTDEIYNEQEESTLQNLRYKARVQALTEANDQFKDVILNQ